MSYDPKIRGRVILLHGFNVTDEGCATVGRLAPYFERYGFAVKRPRYGWRGLLGVRFLNNTFGRLIADLSEPGDIVVGHSNGCAIAAKALEHGAIFDQLVLINPALDSDFAFPRTVRRVHVWHSPSDTPVRFAKFLPWHSWGDMGAVGYTGRDPRVMNYNKETGFIGAKSSGHSDVFADPQLEFFAPVIVGAVLANL